MFDPVHEENGQWYFWDETQADRYGPYPSYEEADKWHRQYCEDCLNGRA